MEEVLSRENMFQVLKKIEQNKGAPGIDNLTVENLKPYLCQNWLSIKEQLLRGDYKSQPVLRVEIPKPDGRRGYWKYLQSWTGLSSRLYCRN
ncbi:MAG: hypothetical protein ACOWWR_19290 [Eubacteriales bacterium]